MVKGEGYAGGTDKLEIFYATQPVRVLTGQGGPRQNRVLLARGSEGGEAVVVPSEGDEARREGRREVGVG